MVIIVYISIILASVTQSATTKFFNKNSSNSAAFNAMRSCTALVLFALIAAFGFTFHLPTVLFGFSYGVCLCISMYAGYQALYTREYSNEFMLFAMLLCSAIFSILAFRKTSFKELKMLRGKQYGVLSGLANAIANFLTLVLTGTENASVLFPIISAGTILASLVCGRLLFKEKLKANHYAALALGIIAVVLLKL